MTINQQANEKPQDMFSKTSQALHIKRDYDHISV